MNRLATIFSIATAAGVLLAAVSGTAWIIAALRHRETVAKALCLAGVILAVLGFVLFLRSYDSSLYQGRTQEPPATQSVTPQQPQEATQAPVAEPEANGTPSEPQRPTEPTQAPSQTLPQESAEENPLAAFQVQERPVMNGFQTERIGTWGYIHTTKEFLSSVTGQQLYDYLEAIPISNYNWFNVFFEDGTGLYFMGSMGAYMLEYGSVDQDEGGAVERLGDEENIYYYHNSHYSIEN